MLEVMYQTILQPPGGRRVHRGAETGTQSGIA
jgi:hypothetical protein